jgi:predicted dehydrogenase
MTRRGALGAGLLILKSETVFGSQANSTLEIGLSGCGGRGTMIGGMFKEFTGARLVALHDVFQDRLDLVRGKLSPDAKLYKGYEAYQDMVSSKLDAVVLESPPYARPDQAAAAVAAGKHLYMAKPVAVDVWGCQKIAATGAKAASAKLTFFTDFQYRGREPYRECVARIRRGDIGVPVVAHVYYHTGRLQPKNRPGESAEVSRLRNWVFDKALSGDIIVEQNIHALDAGVWMLDAQPLSASGTGGRKVRTDVGDCWDHFVVTYWFPNDVKMDFSSSQCIVGYNDICARIYGSEGTAEMKYYASAAITGKKPWAGPEKADTGRGGTIENIKTFADALRAGQILNNTADAVRSNLTAVMGRIAAYGERRITWDEMLRSGQKNDLRLPKLS